WMKKHQRRLLDPPRRGKIEKLVLTLRAIDATHPEVIEKIRIETNCLERNAQRMRYPKFRRQHLFVGSGVIEAGCKTVIGSRLKQSACSGPSEGPTPAAAGGPPVPPSQRPIRELLGATPRRMIPLLCRAPCVD
ncbi:MAG: hypothetical protein ACYDC6_10135, partial [Acidobacteriaceae bacterium]